MAFHFFSWNVYLYLDLAAAQRYLTSCSTASPERGPGVGARQHIRLNYLGEAGLALGVQLGLGVVATVLLGGGGGW